MASNYTRIFNFAVLKKYRWRALDFGDFQDNGYVAMVRGLWEGEYSGAVLKGFTLVSVTGLDFTVGPGIAVGPTGDLMVLNAATGVTGTLPAPVGPVGSRHLVVVRPFLTTPASGIITPPTMPLTTAPLFVDHMAQVVVLDGSGASGAYPATGANDVILFGVRLVSGATGFAQTDVLYQDRDYPGRRNLFQDGYANVNTSVDDDRARCFNAGAPLVGVSPAQTVGPAPKSLLYQTPQTASIFPKDSGGSFNGDSGNTYLNFTTGAITGADQASSAFTPTIPSAGTFIWAVVSLDSGDEIAVAYGTQGTYAQCLAAMRNQTTGGAGSIPTTNNFRLAYVLIGSDDGANITELDVYDARVFAPLQTTPDLTFVTKTGAYNVQPTDEFVRGNTASAGFTFTLPLIANAVNKTIRFKNVGSAGNTLLIDGNGSDIDDLAQWPLADGESVTLYDNGTNWDTL